MSSTSHCPSCGRYVGPYTSCPYCGAHMVGRTSMRLVKLTVVLLTTVGLVSLWYVATHTEIPTVAIGRIEATMNLAYVRLVGRCSRSPSYDPRSGTLSFWITDDSGEIRVSSYGAETRALIEERRVPALGDEIAVIGTLRVAEDFGTLTIDLPEQLTIFRAEPVDRAIGTIGLENQYQRVRVRGQVRDVRQPYPGLTVITLRDASGAVDVAVSEDLVALSGVTPTIGVGHSLEVAAAVSRYRDAPQLVPASAADLVRLNHPVSIAPEQFIVDLSRQGIGRWYTVSGAVINVDRFSSGIKLTLHDGTGTITMLLWQDVYDGLLEDMGDSLWAQVGAELEAHGCLREYRGELELVPELPTDVEVLAAPPAPTVVPPPTSRPQPTPPAEPTETALPTATPRLVVDVTSTPTSPLTPQLTPTPAVFLAPIHSITLDRVGEEVTLEGRVVDTASFSQGFQFTLDDGTGQIVLLTWHDVYDDCWDAPKLNLGAVVRVTGEVREYEGRLEIQPRFGGNVKVVQEATTQAPRRDIGSITGTDEGQRVMIEGRVVRTEGLSSAVKVFLADDSGELLVFIWRNVLERISDNTGLGTPGSLVRVVGTVQTYTANLEVVPPLPNDVTVLEIPQKETE